mgnify:CR=1 FL=1
MGETLFDLTGQMLELKNMLCECADDTELEQIINDSIESVEGALEVKAEGYVKVIQQMEMEQERCDQLACEWQMKSNIRKNAIKRMKDRLTQALIAIDKADGIKAGDYTLKVVKNGGQAPIIYDDESAIPQSLMRIKYEKDSKLIREYLAEHPETTWAHIGERGVHLGIK